MPLFERFHVSQEEAEARLKRALTGDPTRGEIGRASCRERVSLNV